MKRHGLHCICLLAVALASLTPPAYSQEMTTGTIAGTVTDERGRPIADAVVTAQSPQGARRAISDKNGFFIIPFLTPGTYTLQIIAAGFSTVVQDDIVVKLNQKTTVKYAMQPGKVETITVTGRAPLVDRTSTSTGSNVKVSDFTAAIPIGRTYSNLFTTAPGVVSGGGTGAGNYSIGGASGLENSYIIDGVNITNTGYGGIGPFNAIYGSLGTGVTSDFLDEVQVKTGGFEAEWGQALGGVLNAIVKSGTNNFQGGVGFYSTIGALEGSRERVRTELGFINVREEEAYDLAFSFGGPFVKDKLFYYVAINPVETRTSFEAPSVLFPLCRSCTPTDISITDLHHCSVSGNPCDSDLDCGGGETCVGNQAFPASQLGLQERTRRNYNYAAKLSWFMAANHRLDFTAFGDPSRGFNGPQNADTPPPPIGALLFADYAQGGGQSGIRYGGNNGTLKYNGIFTPKFFIDAQISRHDGRFSEKEVLDEYRIRDRRVQLLFNAGKVPIGPANFVGGTGFLSQQNDISTQYSVKLTNVLPGGHELKYGAQFDNIDYLDDQSYSGPALTVFFAASCTANPAVPCTDDADCPVGDTCDTSVFNQVPVTTTSGATFDRRGTTEYRLTRNRYYPTPPATTTKETSAFLQDTWQISSRWVLKAGVRATHEKVSGSGSYTLPIDRTVSNRVGTTSFSPGSYTFDWVFSPRLGLTYDVLGNGKSKLYGNYGRYYQRIPNDLAIRSFSSETSSTRVTYDLAGTPDPSIPWHLQATQVGAPNFQGFPNTRVQEGTKLPYEDEYILGYQQQIRPDLSIEMRGIFRYQGRVLEDVQFAALESIQNYYYGTNYGYPCDPFPSSGVTCPGVPAGSFDPLPFGEYVLANPAQNTPASAGFPNPKRDYKALEFVVNKTFSNNWAMTASYRYAQLKGNYEGLFRNDNGQSDPNITSLFDFPNSPLMEGQFFTGFLNTDRTHVLNLYPYYRWPNGFTIGGGFNWQSGVPRQPFLAHPSYQNPGEIPGISPVYAWWHDNNGDGTADELFTGTGAEFLNDPDAVTTLFLYDYKRVKRGYLGRTPDIVTFDVSFNYPIKFSNDSALNLRLSIFNLFNNQEARGFDDNVESIAGIGNPDFLTPNNYGAPRTVRLAVNWTF
jgi:carboxypeptidase family protein/TonB-dependent receptor-like protein